MKTALITKDAIIEIFDGIPRQVRLINGDTVESVKPGWSDHGMSLVEIKPFVVPDGQRITSTASYVLEAGEVYERYDVESIPAPMPASTRSLAVAALDATDAVAIRCFKAGVAFPDEWRVYVAQLREIVRADSGELPKRPAFPEGT